MRKVAITGIGIVSPIGIGKDAFWNGLSEGQDGIGEISAFDTSAFNCHKAGEIASFDAAQFLGKKGLRYLDRNTRLAAVATSLVLADTGLEEPEDGCWDIGLVLGTTFGSLDSISNFDIDALKGGPRNVTPMAFPNTVINSPAGNIAIRFGLTDINTTISTGISSSLQAINYAADFIRMERADILLAGGAEELCFASFLGAYKMGLLSGATPGQPEWIAPLDIGRNGTVLGEGAAIFALEALDRAQARNGTIYGEILGFGNACDARPGPGFNGAGEGAARAMELALRDAVLDPSQVDYICASANGTRLGDAMEAKAIERVFGRAPKAAISSVKSMLGESLGASGAFQIASSLLTLQQGIVPPTLNYTAGETDWPTKGVSAQVQQRQTAIAQINSFGCDHNHASLLLGRCDQS